MSPQSAFNCQVAALAAVRALPLKRDLSVTQALGGARAHSSLPSVRAAADGRTIHRPDRAAWSSLPFLSATLANIG